MSSLADKLAEAVPILRRSGVAEPRREASSLLSLAVGRDRTFLITHPEYALQPHEIESFDNLVKRRASREPFQYLAGTTEFYGLEFIVTPDVLIPRPETEMVVERTIAILGGHSHPLFCEVGIGSGCIAISVLHDLERTKACGLDISPAALAVARRNAEINGVSDRLELCESDVFSALGDERFDLILSNPPYVPDDDLAGLQPEVRDFEPHVALFGGPEGLSVITQVVDGAHRFLKQQGHLLLEIGFGQSDRVASMFDASLWKRPTVHSDFQGIPRLVEAKLK